METIESSYTNEISQQESHDDMVDNSVCQTLEEEHRLFQLFEIFIEIDKNLKKQNARTNSI